ncbi:MAG: VCBS repeat-containing protein [Deltaproteobacteria bacterium]|nr:VCBS repeat-containing protein [Kofleriaceae bacterium]
MRTIRPASLVLITFLVACGDGGRGDGDGDGGGDGDAGVGDDGGDGDGGVPTCTFTPTGEFNPEVECRWDRPAAGDPHPTYDDVTMTPMVMNLTDDDQDGQVTLADIPDIVFVSYDDQIDRLGVGGVLRVVSGACGADGVLPQHFVVGPARIEADTGVAGVRFDPSGGVALGDVDADGSADIVASLQGGGTIALRRDGSVLWMNRAAPDGADTFPAPQPALADLDGDGKPEVIQGRVILNGEDGTVAGTGTADLGVNGFLGPVAATGDLDLDGRPEVLAGGTAYDAAAATRWAFTYPVPATTTMCQQLPCDGFTATGNFDADDQGEVVSVRGGTIYILNHDGTELQLGGAPVRIAIPRDNCGKNEGGPPTVADFDGDGRAEIGVAAADFYVVADLDCLATPLPAECSDPGIRWKVANFDCSSRVTGSSVFDFDSDGKAEVVYADEQTFRILDGSTGAVRLMQANRSRTRLEMPIVVDVDNDGNAEVVFVENTTATSGGAQGIRVIGDATDSWAATRRVWNQHAYHITNVSELGQIPTSEPANWRVDTPNTISGKLNTFRQNLPEFDALAAPDLTVFLSLVPVGCTLQARVCNDGDVVVGAGVPVRFYDNATMTEIACDGGPMTTPAPLPPGACVDVACAWPSAPAQIDVRACVDNGGYDCQSSTSSDNNECIEDNNRSDASGPFSCVPTG